MRWKLQRRWEMTGEVRENQGCIFIYFSLLQEVRFTIKFTTVKLLAAGNEFDISPIEEKEKNEMWYYRISFSQGGLKTIVTTNIYVLLDIWRFTQKEWFKFIYMLGRPTCKCSKPVLSLLRTSPWAGHVYKFRKILHILRAHWRCHWGGFLCGVSEGVWSEAKWRKLRCYTSLDCAFCEGRDCFLSPFHHTDLGCCNQSVNSYYMHY